LAQKSLDKSPILMFYGYFLSSSGSATYVRNLTLALNKLGQNVILFSQEKQPEKFPFIQKSFVVTGNNLLLNFERKTPFKGKTIHIKADLDGFLPVYVYNPYKDYKTVKEFKDMKKADLDFYFDKLKKAIFLAKRKGILKEVKGIISHHIFPLPFLLQEIFPQPPHLTVFHGTDLNYAILKNPLWLKYFEEKPKNFLFVTASHHGKTEFLKIASKNFVEEKVKIIPPGVDTTLFAPTPNPQKNLLSLKNNLKTLLGKPEVTKIVSEKTKILRQISQEKDIQKMILLWEKLHQYESSHLPELNFQDFLERLDLKKPTLVFCGALNWAKGGQFLMLAAPFLFEKISQLQLVFAGSGKLRGFLQSFITALSQKKFKDLEKIIEIAEERETAQKTFPLSLKEVFRENKKALKKLKNLEKINEVAFAGFLEHENLSLLFSLTDVFVGPSLLPESFGMVAVEAAASGAIPIIPAVYGFGDINVILKNNLSQLAIIPDLLPDNSFFETLQEAIIKAFSLKTKNYALRKNIANLIDKEFSWQNAASKYLQFFKKDLEK